MKLDFSNGVPPDVLDRIKRVKREVDGLESRSLYCPYCNHQSLTKLMIVHLRRWAELWANS